MNTFITLFKLFTIMIALQTSTQAPLTDKIINIEIDETKHSHEYIRGSLRFNLGKQTVCYSPLSLTALEDLGIQYTDSVLEHFRVEAHFNSKCNINDIQISIASNKMRPVSLKLVKEKVFFTYLDKLNNVQFNIKSKCADLGNMYFLVWNGLNREQLPFMRVSLSTVSSSNERNHC